LSNPGHEITDLLSTYKAATGITKMRGTRQTQRQAIGNMGFKNSGEVKAAIDAGLVTFAREHQNNAGGFSFGVTPLQQARRFVVLGESSGTFYVGKLDLLGQNLDVLKKVVAAGDGKKLVDMVVEVSVQGLAPKQDTVIFVLAWLSCHENDELRAYTFKQLGKVLRTPTMQFDFIFKWRTAIRQSHCKKGHGWGRGMRNAFMRIYLDKETKQLAYHVTKYQRRDGASQRDVLRLLHPSVGGKRKSDGSFKAEGVEPDKNLLFAWAVAHGKLNDEMEQEFLRLEALAVRDGPEDWAVLPYLKAIDEALRTTEPERAIELIRAHGLVREQISTAVLKSVSVWGCMLESMPTTALLRNLASMTAKGVFLEDKFMDLAVSALTNPEAIKKARIHPLNVYKAIKVYNRGRGDKGNLTWTPVRQIQDAMQKMFALAFKYGPKTGKKLRVCIDVSGSMGDEIAGMNMTCSEAAAVMSMAFLYAGDPVELCTFNFDSKRGYRGGMNNEDAPHDLRAFKVRKDCTVENFMSSSGEWNGGGTDCALPMTKAIEAGDYSYDGFVVFTDSETWHGKIKPFEALAYYSNVSGKQAKLVVCGMTGTNYTIADPNNPNTIDIVGLDASTPTIVTKFLAGEI
jgi:60 kDa SS-A/Ro ribonucleoprotein